MNVTDKNYESSQNENNNNSIPALFSPHNNPKLLQYSQWISEKAIMEHGAAGSLANIKRVRQERHLYSKSKQQAHLCIRRE